MSVKCSLPRPPPPPAQGPPPPHLPPASADRKKLYQTLAGSRSPVEGDNTEACALLSQREDRKDLQWILVNTYVPSLIQDGPQCGLVALWMAAHLRQPQLSVDMEAVVQTALSRGYTAQGEMFSANNMALLAEEVCGCKAKLLSGGLSGNNAATVITHLWGRQPVLVPYPGAKQNLLICAMTSKAQYQSGCATVHMRKYFNVEFFDSTVWSDMTRTSTMSRVSVAATGRTGLLPQVILGCFVYVVQKSKAYCETLCYCM
ncbi:hypothetical protein F2P81_017125 [Scophthalmus maximus]|uniref:Actin maturation protease n=1 Tax=Scophthalmus maximus TaxID=52904 RepID=A0A6A4SHJ4_SCOMX|nr:hypothetical protein F2P81_017125 [Scophthalmus maximus]